MKKRILSILLVLCVMVGCMPLVLQEASAETGKKITDYSTGDTLEFGWYPQSKVTDEETISQLDAVTKDWISYGYYSGTGDYDDGNMAPSDYMKYCDITLNGSKYRAVMFSKYRKWYTGYTADTSTSYTYQDDNGYYIDNVYYFKYEPLKWRVLDASTGLVVCDSAIDSQAYNNYILYQSSDRNYYGDSTKSHYASDWENSSLRAWLNDDFLNTAFTSSQQSKIKTVTRENKSTSSSTYDSNPTSDKITLLSYWDVLNTSYGFNSSYNVYDTARQRKSTDYAQCQGCWTSTSSSYSGNSWWWLRSPHISDNASGVNNDGWAYYDDDVSDADYGVVPAFNFDTTSAITQCAVTDIGVANYTVETYTMNTSGTYDMTKLTLSGGIGVTAEAEYTVPEGFTLGKDSVTSGKIVSDGSLVLKVYLDRNKYSLTTIIDGVSTPTEFYYGQTISGVTDPTKTGFDFDGWEPIIPTTMPAESVTVTAKWTVKGGYKIAFNDVLTGVMVKDGVKWTDTVLDGMSDMKRDGYTFDGWFRNGTKITSDMTYADLAESDTTMKITLTAKWTDIENPVISGIENGKTYCSAQTVTVTDNGIIKSVTVNGRGVDLDENGKFTLNPTAGEQEIIVTDTDGNTATMKVTVNDGHTGGTATCTKQAECAVCGTPYGKADKTNHVGDTEIKNAKAATCTEDGYTGDTHCKGCGQKLVQGNKIDALGHSGGTATCTKQAECAVCGTPYGDFKPHSYSDVWCSDENGHWHECECGDKSDYAEHTFEWVTDKEATTDETGEAHEECTVCHAKRNEHTVVSKLPTAWDKFVDWLISIIAKIVEAIFNAISSVC